MTENLGYTYTSMLRYLLYMGDDPRRHIESNREKQSMSHSAPGLLPVQGIENIYTQHTPLIMQTLDVFLKASKRVVPSSMHCKYLSLTPFFRTGEA